MGYEHYHTLYTYAVLAFAIFPLKEVDQVSISHLFSQRDYMLILWDNPLMCGGQSIDLQFDFQIFLWNNVVLCVNIEGIIEKNCELFPRLITKT